MILLGIILLAAAVGFAAGAAVAVVNTRRNAHDAYCKGLKVGEEIGLWQGAQLHARDGG